MVLLVEEAIEFLHDICLHDLSEEGVLLSQLLGCEVLPVARGLQVVVEEVDEGGAGRLNKPPYEWYDLVSLSLQPGQWL